ncbi:MAG TPA: NAD(P)-dependent alcohol dehydrogenase [Nocardioides sp.]|uniref:NAD(P)-dependent alcohol dehydrogenase n=1 Tax=Nocardioides sp. TaxID=35761 RepID=UPI002F3E6220
MRPAAQAPPISKAQRSVDAETMRAVVRLRYGGVKMIEIEQILRTRSTPDEVLLRVEVAGLDRGAWHLMTGRPFLLRLAFGFLRPRQRGLGREVSGTVLEVGAAVTKFSVGDEVFGIGAATFAEYAAAREDKLAHKPPNLTFAEAAVVPISGLTALQALGEVGRLVAGQHVLVLGASGGVGSYAVQLANAYGAEVTGVCSQAKAAFVRSLGADHVLDYTRNDFADGTHHYDLILDLGGNPGVLRLRRGLTPEGTAVIVGGEEGGRLTGGMGRQLRALLLTRLSGQRLTTMLCKERSEDLDELAGLIADGTLTPALDQIYPLERVANAMGDLEAGKVRGKSAITAARVRSRIAS